MGNTDNKSSLFSIWPTYFHQTHLRGSTQLWLLHQRLFIESIKHHFTNIPDILAEVKFNAFGNWFEELS